MNEQYLDYYRDSVRSVLVYHKNRYDGILIYSALADGADRLVVEIAMELDIDYVAVLPMPKSIYSLDFLDESRVIFDNLLKNAISVVTMPFVDNNTLNSISYNDNDIDKETQYESAAYFLSDTCDMLLALWDGVDTGLRGGTAETVRYYLSKSNYNLYHVLVSRNSGLTKAMVN